MWGCASVHFKLASTNYQSIFKKTLSISNSAINFQMGYIKFWVVYYKKLGVEIQSIQQVKSAVKSYNTGEICTTHLVV